MYTSARFERLLLAAERGNEEEVLQLLAIEPSLAVVNIPGAGTALHRAAAFGHEGIACILMRYGSNPNTRDDLGQTPFDLAHLKNQAHLVHLLYRQEAGKLSVAFRQRFT